MPEDISSLVAENFLIRAGLSSNKNKELRTGIICGPGGQSGAFSAGCMVGLEEFGLTTGIDVEVGISAGAPNLTFKQSGQAALGTTIYHENNLEGFIKHSRFWKIVDIDHLEKTMHLNKILNVESVRRNPTKLFIALTGLNGQGWLEDAKKSDDILQVIMGSCTLPILNNRPRLVGGVRVMDGGIAKPLPVIEVSEKFQLTDLLVIINQPNEARLEQPSIMEKIAAKIMLCHFSAELEEAFLNRERLFNCGLKNANSGILPNGCRVSIIAPRFKTRLDCMNKNKLLALIEEGRKAIQTFFTKPNL